MTDGSYKLGSSASRAATFLGRLQTRSAIVNAEINLEVALDPKDGASISDDGIVADLRSTKAGASQGLQNVSRTSTKADYATKGIAEVASLASQIKDLAELAAVDTTPSSQRQALDAEAQLAADRITEISNTTYDGTALFSPSRPLQTVQLGNEINQSQTFRFENLSDLNISGFDLTTQQTALASYSLAEGLINEVNIKEAQAKGRDDNLYSAQLTTEDTFRITSAALDKKTSVDLDALKTEKLKLDAILPTATSAYTASLKGLKIFSDAFSALTKKA